MPSVITVFSRALPERQVRPPHLTAYFAGAFSKVALQAAEQK
jgi:hypothetical protein